MALLKPLLGFKEAYHRIAGFTFDEDNQSITFRVKIYPDKKIRDEENIDLRQQRVEFRLCKENYFDLVDDEALKAASDASQDAKIEADIKKEIDFLNKQSKEANIKPPKVSSEMRAKIKTKLINRLASELKVSIVENRLKAVFGSSKKSSDIKKIGYEYLKTLPEFSGAKSDI